MRRCGNCSTFGAHRDRLLNEAVARLFFRKVLALAEWQGLVSDEHFSVDGKLGHALMENRNGLAVDVETTHASGTAEREAAKTMMIRSIRKNKATLGADKGYDMHGFVQAARDRGVTPHVAKKAKGSAIDGRTTRHPGYKTSLIIRSKRIEEIFGWAKTVGGLRKVRFTGLSKVRAQTTFTFAAYNLTRMAAILGWRWSTA